MTPSYGNKMHDLTDHARSVLRDLHRDGPRPTLEINPGVVNRFHREGLTVTVQKPSPFKAHKGGTCNHEEITAAGRAALGLT